MNITQAEIEAKNELIDRLQKQVRRLERENQLHIHYVNCLKEMTNDFINKVLYDSEE